MGSWPRYTGRRRLAQPPPWVFDHLIRRVEERWSADDAVPGRTRSGELPLAFAVVLRAPAAPRVRHGRLRSLLARGVQ